MSKADHKIAVSNATFKPLQNSTICLHQFAGDWRLDRDIVQSNGDVFVFEGQASFTWQQSRLIYKESGQVTAQNGMRLQSERTYLWQTGRDNQINVYFEDGRYFHRFSALAPHAEHLCGSDHYAVNYVFNQWPIWESSWQVTGPKKDYIMTSRYQPV